MSEKIWSDDAWEDYLYWQTQDKKTLKRINQLIHDIERNGCMTFRYIICSISGTNIYLSIAVLETTPLLKNPF